MKLRNLGIIGAGSITREMLDVLSRVLKEPLENISVLVRPGRAAATKTWTAGHLKTAADRIEIIEDAELFMRTKFDLVIEAAGHSAVEQNVPALLGNGVETVIASTGALSDPDLYEKLEAAAIRGETRLVLPAGAVGGMDILAGLKHADIEAVTYTSRKPPGAWKGTRAETLTDLETIETETVFFEGTARQAASDYPKNANVAATIALAGAGFEKTKVQMIADPGVSANVHSFDVVSDAAELSIRIIGKPSAANPKTSLPTVYSLVREVMRRVLPIVS